MKGWIKPKHREHSYCHRKPHPQLIMSRGTIVSCTAWKSKELNSVSFILSLSSALCLGLFYSSAWMSGMNICFGYSNCIWNPSLFSSKVKISQSRLHLWMADEIASVVLGVLHLLFPPLLFTLLLWTTLLYLTLSPFEACRKTFSSHKFFSHLKFSKWAPVSAEQSCPASHWDQSKFLNLTIFNIVCDRLTRIAVSEKFICT